MSVRLSALPFSSPSPLYFTVSVMINGSSELNKILIVIKSTGRADVEWIQSLNTTVLGQSNQSIESENIVC